MANPNLPIANPLAYLGNALGLARQGMDTQAFFTAITAEMESRGEQFGPSGAVAFSRLRSQATAMATAQRNFAAAPSSYAVESSMIGVVPYGPTAQGIMHAPTYNVRTTYTTREGGQDVIRSFVTEGIDPSTMTVGELRAQAYADAADAAAGYEGGLVGTPSISLEQL